MNMFLKLSVLLAVLSGSASAQSLPPSTYQGPVFRATVPNVRAVKPLWTLAIDQAEYGEQSVLVGADRVLVKISGTWQARALATGKIAWTLRQPGQVQALTPQAVLTTVENTLQAHSLQDGKRLWIRRLGSSIQSVGQSGGGLYVTTDQGGAALDAETGKVRWIFTASEMGGFRQETGGVVFWEAYQGEPHFPAVYAFDAQTGKQLYRLGGTVGPLAVRDGQVLMADAAYLGGGSATTIEWVGQRSGQVQQTLELAADFQCTGGGLTQRNTADTFYASPHAYVVDQCGARVRQFWIHRPGLSGQATAPALSPDRTFAAPGDSQYRAGPLKGVLILEDRNGGVRLIPTSGGSLVNYNGVAMPTGMGTELPGAGPVSRLDVLGNTLYLGRATGSLLAYDLKNMKPLYAARLPWTGFGPSLRSGEYVVLTAPGQVAVIREGR